MTILKVNCWCYTAKKQVWVKGRIEGKRQADLLRVDECEEKSCQERNSTYCLIGKLREGVWLQTQKSPRDIESHLRKWRLPREVKNYKDTKTLFMRIKKPKMSSLHESFVHELQEIALKRIWLSDDRGLNLREDLLTEGYCEECYNYAILYYCNGAYLCFTCRYLKGYQ